MKRLICILFSVVLIVFTFAALSACNNNNDASPTEAAKKHDYGNPMSHPLYIRAQSDCESVVATFKNSQMALSDIPVHDMEKIEDEGETAIYRCYQDAADFDRVVVTVDGKDSDPPAGSFTPVGSCPSPTARRARRLNTRARSSPIRIAARAY